MTPEEYLAETRRLYGLGTEQIGKANRCNWQSFAGLIVAATCFVLSFWMTPMFLVAAFVMLVWARMTNREAMKYLEAAEPFLAAMDNLAEPQENNEGPLL